MFDVETPRGPVRVPMRHVAKASDRLFRLNPEQRTRASEKARAVLEQRDSLRAAAVIAAAAALAAVAIPTIAA